MTTFDHKIEVCNETDMNLKTPVSAPSENPGATETSTTPRPASQVIPSKPGSEIAEAATATDPVRPARVKHIPSIIRIPKIQEKHPKFLWLATVYGFGKLVQVTPEDDALTRQPSMPEGKDSPVIQDPRDMTQVFSLGKQWSFRFNCENTFGDNVVTWGDIEHLTQADLVASKMINETEHKMQLNLAWSHQGLMKHLEIDKGTLPHVRVTCQHDGSMGFESKITGKFKEEILLSDDELVKVINEMWDLEKPVQVGEYCQTRFPESRAKQFGLLFTFALNNLIAKTMRNQIAFY